MTGYAAASADSPRGRLSVELRSVNSRFLDLQFRVADELRALEPALREMVTARVSRGKVDCRLFLNQAGPDAVPRSLDPQALSQLGALAEQAKHAFPDAAPLGLADVLRWPGVIAEAAADEQAIRQIATAIMQRALEDLVAARAREGAKLAASVLERVAAMRSRVQEVAPLVPQSVAAYQERIAERLREAIGSADDDQIGRASCREREYIAGGRRVTK